MVRDDACHSVARGISEPDKDKDVSPIVTPLPKPNSPYYVPI